MAAVAYYLMARTLLASHGSDSALATALGRDFKGKVSMLLYAAGIALAFLNRWGALAIYALVALWWLVPDRRIEKRLHPPAHAPKADHPPTAH
jgi:uncharacterized membrane protein